MSCDAWVNLDKPIRWKCYSCGEEFWDDEKWHTAIQAQHRDCRKKDDRLLAVDLVQGFEDN